LDGAKVCAFADQIPGWQGIGNLIVLDGEAIRNESQPGQFERCLLNTALHEAGHLTPTLPKLPPELVNYDPPAEFQARALAKLKVDEPEPEPGTPDDAHDWKFARRCCHLFFRACAAGYNVPLHRLFGWSSWQSPAEHYLPHVLHECIRMQGETFAAIEATEPPAGFVELWQADLDYYHLRKNSKCHL
jgi:hypothetical protein